MSAAISEIRRTRYWPEIYDIRSSRARTFRAALQQFEELIAAAETAGPASAPLPLFYALSQAGRAMAALRLRDPWQLRGHGLKFKWGDDQAIAASRVEIRERRTPGRPMSSFHGVAVAVGSQLPTEKAIVTLQEVVNGIDPLTSGTEAGPIAIDGTVDWRSYEEDRGHVLAALQIPEDLRSLPNMREALRRRLRNYPRGSQFKLPGADFLIKDPASHGWIEVYLPIGDAPKIHKDHRGWHNAADAALDAVVPVSPNPRDHLRYLRPLVGSVEMAQLPAWWLLLFALSSLARYHPGEWRSALSVDTSADAVFLENALEMALDVVPQLVLSALHAALSADAETASEPAGD